LTLKTIVVTWMDGPAVTYADVTTSDLNGTLHVYRYRTGSPEPIGEWHFPTCNIRSWGPRAWEADHGAEDVG
jgi:hypothetical protein